MAKTDLGKKWESEFKSAWKAQFPGTFVFRLNDQMTGYKETSGNPCDFLCFANNKLFMVECKEHKGISEPFVDIPQYDRLLKYKGIKNVYPGVLIWFSDINVQRVIWVSIDEMEKMVKDGEKSIGLRMFKDKLYNIVELPVRIKSRYVVPDLSILVNKEDTDNDR